MVSSDNALSRNDSTILAALFDPETSLSNFALSDQSLPDSQQEESFKSVEEQERKLLFSINQEDVSEEDVRATISALTNIISKYPGYASAYNNRAQATRLLFTSQELPKHPRELHGIIDDLGEAIAFATPESVSDPVSGPDARVLASAHTHRGYLLWLAYRSETMADAIGQFMKSAKILTPESLAEMASQDFAAGGRYGNSVAKQMAVKTNPYAKLCGNIVREAIQRDIKENLLYNGIMDV